MTSLVSIRSATAAMKEMAGAGIPCLLYRLPDRSYIVCRLRDVRHVRAGDADVGAKVREILEETGSRARADATPAGVGDGLFALSHDLQWALRDPELEPSRIDVCPSTPVAVFGFCDGVLRYPVDGSPPASDGVPLRPRRDSLETSFGSGHGPVQPFEGRLTSAVSDFDEVEYARQVAEVKALLEAGEIYQAVISATYRGRPRVPVDEYCAQVLIRYSSSKFAYWLSVPEVQFMGACSLPHVSWDDGEVSTLVFAGTTAAPGTDDGQEGTIEPRATKQFSEHVMLVDLERHDLGTIAQPNGVTTGTVMRPRDVGPTTYYSTKVSAVPHPTVNLADVVLCNFPRGVVVGAPKSRAQELVQRVESRNRGFYTGALGLFRGAARQLVSNTIVTCALVEDTDLRIDVAGGLVHASDAERELFELRLKMKATA